MSTKPLDVHDLIKPDALACHIADSYQMWQSARSGWISERQELRNFLYATDTRTTKVDELPWFNSTTTPKLTQIYDNLVANYMAALFSNERWLSWEGDDEDSDGKEKRKAIEAYMYTKTRQQNFENIVESFLRDFIRDGNCFATVEYVRQEVTGEDGQITTGYVGPRAIRISPLDIVFDPTASDFKFTPKIIRSTLSMGEVARKYPKAYTKMLANRRDVSSAKSVEKDEAFRADGFGSIEQYYTAGYVEVLTFMGDIFDIDSGVSAEGRMITVLDRAYQVEDQPIPSWLGEAPVFTSGWRDRPDNLWSMGPLDNLVGMQYRIDHLENLKADVFDQIALPMIKIQGDVEDFVQQPGERIYIGEEGDVGYLSPDGTALQADFQIASLEKKMEEYAGAPKEAMGIRTPGEKTAFEIQSLENAASRIFKNKTDKFSREFLEPLLNAMFESAMRNMDRQDVIRVTNSDTGTTILETITKDDVAARGKIYPMGARHFAEKARRVQNLTNLLQYKNDPTIAPHLSGKRIAEILAEEIGEPGLYAENISLEEQMETQKASTDFQVNMEEEQMVKQEMGM